MERLFLPFVPQVKQIITHYRPHLDELGAWWLALRFGTSIFPGIENAKLVLWNAGNKTPDGRTPRQWKDESGALLLGVGGAKTSSNPDGAEFDEHGLNNDKSTLILMAEAIGVTTDPALRGLLKYTQANDRKGNATPWDLASSLKAINGHTLNTMEAAHLVFDTLDSNYARELAADPGWTSHKYAHLFDEYLAQWLWETFAGKARDSVKRPTNAHEVIEYLRIGARLDISEIKKIATRDHTKGAAGPFDIVTMFSELVENGADSATQHNFVYVNMNAKFAQQRRFAEAENEVRENVQITWIGDAKAIEKLKKSRFVEDRDTLRAIADLEASEDATDPKLAADVATTVAELRSSMTKPGKVLPNAVILTERMEGIRPIQVVSCVSDNEEILKAMRVDYPDAEFHIRRQPSKHSVINGPKHLMDSVCAEIRLAENIRRNGSGGSSIPVERLRQAGNIAEDPVWCFHREGGQMLNGSLTSPGAPHTLQSLEGLWKAIARAVRYSAVSEQRYRLPGAPPPARRLPGGKSQSAAPAAAKAPAKGNGGNRKGGHTRRGNHRGRRPEQATRPAASSGGGFDNKPFASIPPVATPDPERE